MAGRRREDWDEERGVAELGGDTQYPARSPLVAGAAHSPFNIDAPLATVWTTDRLPTFDVEKGSRSRSRSRR